MRGRTYTEADKDAAHALAQSGHTCDHAAELLDIPRSTVYYWGLRYGWTWGPIGAKYHGVARRAEALRLARTGLTRHEVAAQLGIPYGTVSKWARRYGWNWPAVKTQPPRSRSNCDTCPDRPQCSQHHAPCEQSIMIDGHPDTHTLTFDEAYLAYP